VPLLAWRHWLGVTGERVMHVPASIVATVCAIGEVAGAGPLGNTMRRMLERNNVAGAAALGQMERLLALKPVSLAGALAARPAQVQDRLHAALYFVFPLMQWSLAVIWMVSAVAGFVTPAAQVRELFSQAGLPAGLGPPLVYAVSVLDAILGVLVLSRRAMRIALLLMLISVLGYTGLIGVLWPVTWLEPFGGLLKNLALIPAILMLLAWTRQR
jgi:hypothetical protein